jgi:nitric oxide reductase subunit B
LAIAGALITVPSLYTLGITPPQGWLALLGALFVLVAWLILAAHGYRALADRNPSATLAAHWTTLALLLFLLGPALLGGLQIMPDAHAHTQGTRLTDLQHTLTLLAVVAAVLGTINQASAELRGRNQRVTGFIPLWLVGFGLVGATLALGGAGIAQVYLERVLSLGYLETQTLIAPLYALWTLSLLLVTLGLAAYALGFWARRPVERQWVDRV